MLINRIGEGLKIQAGINARRLHHCPGLQLCGALGNIKALRERLGEVDEGTYASACTVVALQTRRRNIAATVDMLQVGICHVPQHGLNRHPCHCGPPSTSGQHPGQHLLQKPCQQQLSMSATLEH